METEFKIVEGLSLKTRFDALEKQWGSSTMGADSSGRRATGIAGSSNSFSQENIEFEEVFMDFATGIGRFQVGYQPWTNFGTNFLYTASSDAGIRYQLDKGPATVFAKIAKKAAQYNTYGDYYGTSSTSSNFIANDSDKDVYELGATGRFAAGEAGIMAQYWRDATNRRSYASATGTMISPTGNGGYMANLFMLNPYTKLKFGNNFYIEAEAYYKFGTLRKYEDFAAANPNEPDVSVNAYGAYVNARVDFKPVYGGLQFIMMSGDDMKNKDSVTGSLAGMYAENKGFNKTLIMWNSMYTDATGPQNGNMRVGAAGYINPRTGSSYSTNNFMDNVWFYQAYVGVKPMAKLDLKAALSYATADKKPKMCVGSVGDICNTTTGGSGVAGQTNKEFVGGTYGWELDVTAAYAIYDNLTYTVGVGYLWAGDYYKGYDDTVQVKDNYILMHNLTLAF
jgi:hypothetical protein